MLLVRAFFLPVSQPAEERRKVALQVRASARIRKVYLYNALGALAVRGTEGPVATAEKLMEQMKVK